MPQKIDKFKQLLEILNDGVGKTEFIKSFRLVIKHIAKLEQELIKRNDTKTLLTEKDLKKLKEEFAAVIGLARKESDSTFGGIKRRMLETINSLFIKNRVRERMKQVDERIREIRDGRDGRDGADGIDGKDAKDVDEEAIVRKISEEIGQKKIKISAIRGLRKMLEELKERPLVGGGGFSYIHMMRHFINDETPTGTVNGTNTDFVLQNSINPEASLKVFVNGMRMRITEDYTFSGRTITFLTAPPTGSILMVDYMK